MTDKQFIKFCKEEIKKYTNARLDKTDGVQITEDDVYIVWSCKTLQNWKALVSTTLADGMYYEVTHNGDKNETYIDAYKKWENIVVKHNNISRRDTLRSFAERIRRIRV